MNTSNPKLHQWLAMPISALADQVAAHKLAIYVSTDGTQRYYLMAHPEEKGRISDYNAYAQFMGLAYSRMFDLLFSLGIHTIITANLYPPNFQRGAALLEQMIALSRTFLVNEPFTGLYKKWQVQTRLYGDYDLAPAAAAVRSRLMELDKDLAEITPGRERLLLFGYCAGSRSDEWIARTLTLYQSLNRPPSTNELRNACFPHGPESIHLTINSGWMRPSVILPSAQDGGTDFYNLSHLAFDLTESEVRRILYDHLFLRHAAPEDNMPYTQADIEVLREYYAQKKTFVIGLGHLIGPGLWYPDYNPIDG